MTPGKIIPSDTALIDDLTGIASKAAAAILAVRGAALNPQAKPDRTPVTTADKASEAVILDGLARLLPGIPVLAEESAGRTDLQSIGNEFLLVDPLDGTRELLAGRDEFTINVALVCEGVPVLGIVAAPALGLVWRTAAGESVERLRLAPGASADAATERTAVRTRPMPADGIVAAVSRSHFDAATQGFLAQWKNGTPLVSGSAIKFCRVAEGAADIYPRLAPTSLWDVAAGHAVLAAAGGTVTSPEGRPLAYRPSTDGIIIPAFIAWGDPTAATGRKPDNTAPSG